MAYEHREGSGSLFKNDKATSDKAPGYTGVAMINGVLHDVAAWVKEGNKGRFFSLSIKPKEDRPKGESRASKVEPELDDDIPF